MAGRFDNPRADAVMARIHVSLLQRLVPLAVHRVLVIDPGRRHLKLLLAESRLGRFRLLHQQAVALPDAGVLDPDELRQHLALVVPDLGPHSVALVLPQHKAITQTVDVPLDLTRAPESYLLGEALKLSGLPEEELAIGIAPLQPWGSLANPHALAFCKKAEIDALIDLLVPGPKEELAHTDRLAEITTTAQGLVAASKAILPAPYTAILVDLGAQETAVVFLLDGQGILATSFEGGSEAFTRGLVEAGYATADGAESLQHSNDLFQGPNAVEPLIRAVEKWHGEIERCVTEWIEDIPHLGLSLAHLPVYLAGGGAAQKGLVEHLNRCGPMRYQRWPALPDTHSGEPMDQYWVSYGVARMALGKEPNTLSFLPVAFRQSQLRRRTWEVLQAVIVALMAAVILVLALGTWQNKSLLAQKRALITQTEQALESAWTVAELAQEADASYAALGPILERRGQTLLVLRSWLGVNQVRTNDDFWLVLFADGASYMAGATAPQAATNVTSAALGALLGPPASPYEFIAEVCIPQRGETARRTLSQFVLALKRLGIFANVDALPAERKRELVDSRVIISNQVYGVSMEMPADPLLHPPPRERHRTGPGRAAREAVRPVTPVPETAEQTPPDATTTNR